METEWKKELCRVFLAVKNRGEWDALLHSLFTPAEYDEFARRWQVVSRLMAGKPHRLVSKQTRVGIGTVTRGAREIKYGSGILQKLHKRLSSQNR